MTTLTASEARKRFFRLMDDVANEHEPLLVTGKRNNVVILSEEDWQGIQTMLQLEQIPGMVESIKDGLQTPISKMSDTLPW